MHTCLLRATPKTDSITVSFLGPRFEGFVDMNTVDTTSVLSKVSLAGPIEEARSRFPQRSARAETIPADRENQDKTKGR